MKTHAAIDRRSLEMVRRTRLDELDAGTAQPIASRLRSVASAI